MSSNLFDSEAPPQESNPSHSERLSTVGKLMQASMQIASLEGKVSLVEADLATALAKLDKLGEIEQRTDAQNTELEKQYDRVEKALSDLEVGMQERFDAVKTSTDEVMGLRDDLQTFAKALDSKASNETVNALQSGVGTITERQGSLETETKKLKGKSRDAFKEVFATLEPLQSVVGETMKRITSLENAVKKMPDSIRCKRTDQLEKEVGDVANRISKVESKLKATSNYQQHVLGKVDESEATPELLGGGNADTDTGQMETQRFKDGYLKYKKKYLRLRGEYETLVELLEYHDLHQYVDTLDIEDSDVSSYGID